MSVFQFFRADVPHATYYRSGAEDTQHTYNTHIWMINRLLMHSPRSFSRYVVATCYLRMLRRMNYHLSLSFRRALKKAQEFTFSEQYYDPSPSEKANDANFLSALPEIASLVNETPKLLETRGANNIYTSDTSTEFHLLLLELLEKFSEYLAALKDIQNSPESKEQILDQLDLVIRVGTMLRFMVRGSAIKTHLKVIEDFLPKREDSTQGSSGDEDEELAPLDNDKSSARWKAGLDWLELMVTHFDAIQTLVRFTAHRPTIKIDIKILSLVPPDNKMLPWKDLLNHKTYFPGDRPGAAAEDLIAFLSPPESENMTADKEERKMKKGKKENQEEAVSAEDVMQLLKNLCGFKFPDSGDCGRAIDDIVHKIGLINNCTSAGSQSYANSIVEELKDFKSDCLSHDQDEAIKDITRISSMVRTLRASAMLRGLLRKGSPLEMGVGFNGDHHCEGSLATFCTYEAEKLGFVSCLF